MLILSLFESTRDISTKQPYLYTVYSNTLLISSQEVNVKNLDTGMYLCLCHFLETFREKEKIDFFFSWGDLGKDIEGQCFIKSPKLEVTRIIFCVTCE